MVDNADFLPSNGRIVIFLVIFLSAILIHSIFLEGYNDFAPRSEQTSLPIDVWVPKFHMNKSKAFVMSWDDARYSDALLAQVDDKYGLKHTIFAPSFRLYPEYDVYAHVYFLDEMFRGHDIQSHNGRHVHLSKQSPSKQAFYIKWGCTGLWELYGIRPLVFAYPFGDVGGKESVKQVFELGRTIYVESGVWPPRKPHLAGVTYGTNGITDHNVLGIDKRLSAIDLGSVFKGYGHTNWPGLDYGVTNFTKYEMAVKEFFDKKDVWYTTWGELVAYSILRNNLRLNNAFLDHEGNILLEIQWNVDTSVYNVPITILLQDALDYVSNPMLLVDGKISNDIRKENNDLFISVRPQRGAPTTKIYILENDVVMDTSPPRIRNVRIKMLTYNETWAPRSTQEVLSFPILLFEVFDEESFIEDVNITVLLNNGSRLQFNLVENPIFWNNNTYGRVLFNVGSFDLNQRLIPINITFIDSITISVVNDAELNSTMTVHSSEIPIDLKTNLGKPSRPVPSSLHDLPSSPCDVPPVGLEVAAPFNSSSTSAISLFPSEVFTKSNKSFPQAESTSGNSRTADNSFTIKAMRVHLILQDIRPETFVIMSVSAFLATIYRQVHWRRRHREESLTDRKMIENRVTNNGTS